MTETWDSSAFRPQNDGEESVILSPSHPFRTGSAKDLVVPSDSLRRFFGALPLRMTERRVSS